MGFGNVKGCWRGFTKGQPKRPPVEVARPSSTGVAERVRLALKKHGGSQRWFAEFARVPFGTLQELLREVVSPKDETLDRVLKALSRLEAQGGV